MAPVPRRPRARLTSQHAQDTDTNGRRGSQKLPLLEMHAMRAVGGWRVTVTARASVITAGFFFTDRSDGTLVRRVWLSKKIGQI